MICTTMLKSWIFRKKKKNIYIYIYIYKYKLMLMLMHKLNTTMDKNVKEILPKGLPKVQDGELALHN